MIPEWLASQNIIILVLFLLVIFFVYKAIRIAMRAVLVAIAAFSFPWVLAYIAPYLGMVSPFPADISTGLNFALAGLAIFAVYELLHFIIYFLKLVTWPFRAALGHEKKVKLKKLEKKVDEIEKG